MQLQLHRHHAGLARYQRRPRQTGIRDEFGTIDPDFLLFGPDRSLVYRGRFDKSRPNSDVPVTGADLRAAVGALLTDAAVAAPQYPPMGCSIKWKPGNEPA